MVYAASEMGVGRESMSAMHDILNMASLRNRSAWNNHTSEGCSRKFRKSKGKSEFTS
jgi:hypothetical protein